MELKFQVQIKIQKSVAEVFDAVYDPEKLSGYFTNGGASAPMDEGTTVEWGFADTPGQEIRFPVAVKQTTKNELIAFGWQSTTAGDNTRVEIKFEADGDSTVVHISESGWSETQDDLNRSYGNCMAGRRWCRL